MVTVELERLKRLYRLIKQALASEEKNSWVLVIKNLLEADKTLEEILTVIEE